MAKRKPIRVQYYTTEGTKSGRCGHRHPSHVSAALCQSRHQRADPESDRRVIEVAR